MKREPAWKHELPENYNMTEDGVVGNFEAALQYLIDTIKNEEGLYSTTLAQFDSLRGNDWYTQTGSQLHGIYKGE